MSSESNCFEKLDLEDFMTNDNNPTLVRLVDQMMQDPEFNAILEQINNEANNE